MIPLVLGAALVAGCALGAVAWPLLVYTTSLAALGLAHVASELRYVHVRFGAAMRQRVALAIAALLVGVVCLRLARMADLLAGSLATQLELGLVFCMIAAPLPLLMRQGMRPTLTAIVALTAIGAGLALSPIHTLLALAVLHNWTPVGFLLEALDPPAKRRWMPVVLCVFIGLPLLIATGLPFALLCHVPGLVQPEVSVLPAGYLADHLGAYLPRAWHERPWSLHAFSAIVFAQCMHYAAVLHVLPRLLPQRAQRPSGLFYAALALCGGALFVGFTQDFAQARQVYGVAAAIHAWIELPLLLVALSAPAAMLRHEETPCAPSPA